MKYNNLINQCDMFYKKATFIEPPPVLLKDVTDFIINTYAGRILGKNDKKLFKEISQYTTSPIMSDSHVIKLIPININNWKYLDIPNVKEKIQNNNKIFGDMIEVIVRFVSDKSYHEGAFNGHDYPNKIRMDLSVVKNFPNVNSFKYDIDKIKWLLIHELSHWSQINLTKILNGEFGSPPNKYRNKLERTEQNVKLKHEVRDHEFYTNLQDSFKYFKNRMDKVKPNNKIDFFKKWVLNEAPFKQLKKIDNDKYQLAIKIFWKEFQKLPINV